MGQKRVIISFCILLLAGACDDGVSMETYDYEKMEDARMKLDSDYAIRFHGKQVRLEKKFKPFWKQK